MNLKDKVAIVTGASSGVGYAIAETLAKNGTNLVLAARSFDKLKEFADDFSSNYGIKTIPIKTDLTIINDIINLFEKTKKEFGRLDLLINVAGIFPEISFVKSTTEQFIASYNNSRALMLDAVIYTTKLGLDLLLKNKGIIINISSDAGLEKKVYPNQVPYHAAKAGVNHATRAIDLEIKNLGSRAFAIAPGNIDTPLLRKAIAENSNLISLIEKKVGSLELFYSKILKPKDIANKVIDIINNTKKYKNSVIEMESYEF